MAEISLKATKIDVIFANNTSLTKAEVLYQTSAYPDALVVGNGFVARGGTMLIESKSIGGIVINDGEVDYPDEGDYVGSAVVRLSEGMYAKLPTTFGEGDVINVLFESPLSADKLAEYWLELFISADEDLALPEINFVNPLGEEETTNIQVYGDATLQHGATHIWHFTSSDGGYSYLGELRKYII